MIHPLRENGVGLVELAGLRLHLELFPRVLNMHLYVMLHRKGHILDVFRTVLPESKKHGRRIS